MARTFGRYRLIRHLATGGMGEVWLAEAAGAAGFVKRLVIKTLRSELAADARLVEQFVAEGRLLEALDHPNIAQILDLGCINGEWFLAMEWVQGFDLRALRRALPSDDGVCRLGTAATLAIVGAAASALDHAATREDERGQRLRIVHHDVTPSNLMVRRDGLVKLVDFGVARSALLAHVEVGALRGKIPYLAPEQLQPSDVDGRTDLFALGLCAFELLTGERALQAVDVDGLPAAWHALQARLALLDDVGCDAGLAALVRSLCALDVAARPRDAGHVAAAAAERSVQLGIGRPELVLAHELAPAFARLEAQEGGFDATLAGMVAVDRRAGAEGTGTLSLPGLSTPSPLVIEGRVVPGPFATPAPGVSAGDAPQAATTSVAGRAPMRVSAATPTPAPTPASTPVPTPTSSASVPSPEAASKAVPRRSPLTWALAIALAVAVAALWLQRSDERGPRRPVAAEDAVVSAPDAGAEASVPTPSAAEGAAVAAVPDGVAPAAANLAAPLEAVLARSAPAALAVAVTPDVAAALVAPAAAPAAVDSARAEPKPDGKDGKDGKEAREPAAKEAKDGKESRDESRDRRENGVAVIRFRVVPADAEVSIDRKKVAGGPGSTGVYELRVAAGSHRIEVRDPLSAAVERRTLELRPGEERHLPGFVLVGGLP